MFKYWVLVGSLNPLISTLQFTTCSPTLSFVSQITLGTNPAWIADYPKFPTTIYATDMIATRSINALALGLTTGGLTRHANVSGGGPTRLGFVNNGAALNLDPTGTDSAQRPGPLPGLRAVPQSASPQLHQVGIISKSGSLHVKFTDWAFLSRLCNSPTKCSSLTLVRIRFGALFAGRKYMRKQRLH